MPALDPLLAFTAAAFLIIIVPGPSVLFVVGRALAYGPRVAVGTAAGNAAGSFALAAAVALGLGAIIQTSAIAYTTIKMAGAAYLIHLGIRAIRHRRAIGTALGRPPGSAAGGERGGRGARSTPASQLSGRRTWWEGLVVGVTNPKTAVFLAAVLPQFIDRTAGHPGGQMLLLAAIYTLIALVCDTGYGLAAGTVRDWFARSTRRLESVGGAAGLTMIGLGVGVAVTGRRD